jgi:hypothetical protein
VARGNLPDNRGAVCVASLRRIGPVANGKRGRTREGRLQKLASVDHVSILSVERGPESLRKPAA